MQFGFSTYMELNLMSNFTLFNHQYNNWITLYHSSNIEISHLYLKIRTLTSKSPSKNLGSKYSMFTIQFALSENSSSINKFKCSQ